MSDLLLPLILLGVLIIAGVVMYNWLQERKLRNQVSNDFIVPQKDVLAEDFYIDADAFVDKQLAEISAESKTHDAAHAASIKPDEAIQFNDEVFAEPVVETVEASQASELQKPLGKPLDEPFIGYGDAFDAPVEDAEADAVAAPKLPEMIVEATLREQIQNSQPELPSEIHPQVDLSAILYANDSISSQALIELKASLIDIGLPFFLHGLDAETKWQLIDDKSAQTRFKQVACSVQLADRGGAIAKQLLNKFQFAVESMGLEQNAHVEWQGSGDAMHRAAELDKFCIDVDQLISVHLVQGESPIHGTKLRGLAEASGMLLSTDGKFYHQNSTNEAPLFYMIDSTNHPFSADNLRSNVLKGVTFQIEIPKASNCEQAFNQMILVAQKMSSSLNTNLVDDLQKPLGDLQIEKIRQQLKVIHATMVARGIMPGSPVSMRLFN
jgi:FtsZ-interacting cell division protein ZipA